MATKLYAAFSEIAQAIKVEGRGRETSMAAAVATKRPIASRGRSSRDLTGCCQNRVHSN